MIGVATAFPDAFADNVRVFTPTAVTVVFAGMLAPVIAMPTCQPVVEATAVRTLEPNVVVAVVFNCMVVPTHCAHASDNGSAPQSTIELTNRNARKGLMVVRLRLGRWSGTKSDVDTAVKRLVSKALR